MKIQSNLKWPDGFPLYNGNNELIFSEDGAHQQPMSYVDVSIFRVFGIDIPLWRKKVINFSTNQLCIDYNRQIIANNAKPFNRARLYNNGTNEYIVDDKGTKISYVFSRETEAQIFTARLNNKTISPVTQFYRGANNVTHSISNELQRACSCLNVISVTTTDKVDGQMFLNFKMPDSVINPCNLPPSDEHYTGLIQNVIAYLTSIIYETEESHLRFVGNSYNNFDQTHNFEFIQVL